MDKVEEKIILEICDDIVDALKKHDKREDFYIIYALSNLLVAATKHKLKGNKEERQRFLNYLDSLIEEDD